MQPTPAGELLDLWEQGVVASPMERANTLLLAGFDEAPASLGARNAALLSLRARLFGGLQLLHCHCSRCGATVEFSIDCDALAQQLAPAGDVVQSHRLHADGVRIDFQLPVAADLRFATRHAAEPKAFVHALLRRCIVRCEREDGVPLDPVALSESVTDALSRSMEALDPGAAVIFDLVCPDCDARWSARMDCGEVLWSELQSRAERLLSEIDALARAYGWTEAEVLQLSATRRAAYLQLVGAA